jgi:hypothetical protein
VTDFRLTQAAVEEWAAGAPAIQLTQAAVEMWGSVATTTVQMVLTLAAVEMWAPVVPVSRGAPRQALIM